MRKSGKKKESAGVGVVVGSPEKLRYAAFNTDFYFVVILNCGSATINYASELSIICMYSIGKF